MGSRYFYEDYIGATVVPFFPSQLSTRRVEGVASNLMAPIWASCALLRVHGLQNACEERMKSSSTCMSRVSAHPWQNAISPTENTSASSAADHRLLPITP